MISGIKDLQDFQWELGPVPSIPKKLTEWASNLEGHGLPLLPGFMVKKASNREGMIVLKGV